MKTEILTYSGGFYNFAEPSLSVYTIEDVAQALSMTCRFGGHTRKFYSVCQHAVMVSYLVAEENAREGLHHDDVEAFLTDIPSPLKQLLPDYKNYEHKAEEDHARRFNLRFPYPADVKRADLIMLASEMKSLMPRMQNEYDLLRGVIPLKAEVKPWSPEKAKREYLKRHYELEEKFNKEK